MPLFKNFQEAIAYQESSDILVIIPTFNNPTYLEFMLEQLLEKGVSNLIICDNNSTMPQMVDCLSRASLLHKVVLLQENLGPRVYLMQQDFFAVLPEYFVITDPDLMFNPKLPNNFLHIMQEILKTTNYSKIGFALDIYSQQCQQKFENLSSVQAHEQRFWEKPLSLLPEYVLYDAIIDTTFALYNKTKYCEEFNQLFSNYRTSSIRIGGDFTCQHMGWWSKEFVIVPLEELEFYAQHQTWSFTLGVQRS